MSEARNIRIRGDIKRMLSIAVLRCGLDASDIASRAIRKGRRGGFKDVVVEEPKRKTTTIPVRLRLEKDVADASDDELRDYLSKALWSNRNAEWPWEMIKQPEYEEGIDYTVTAWGDGR